MGSMGSGVAEGLRAEMRVAWAWVAASFGGVWAGASGFHLRFDLPFDKKIKENLAKRLHHFNV